MKYLVLMVVLVLGYAWWRSQRSAEPPARRPPPAGAPQDMVACARCGVHLPRSEALTHGTRSYCCAEHQRGDAV